MELNEAARRIVGQHWRLILVCLFIGIAAAALLNAGKSRTYTATTRITLDTPDPRSRAEAMGIADTARAIATSPSQVGLALSKAQVRDRDPVEVATNQVSVAALGASGVVRLSVSDKSPQVAAAVANALAAGLIRARLEYTSGQVKETLSDLDERIADLNRRISNVDARIDELDVAIATAPGGSATAFRRERNDAARSRDFLAQQRVAFESERAGLRTEHALRPRPSIISASSVPRQRDSYNWPPIIALGGMLGLILGIGVAGLREMIRPTLVGGDSVARELDTQLMGTLANDPWAEVSPRDLASVAIRLRFAAEAAAIQSVGLLATGEEIYVGRLAAQLNAVLLESGSSAEETLEVMQPQRIARVAASSRSETEPMSTVVPAGTSRRARASAASTQGIRVKPFTLEDSSPTSEGSTGLVLVSPAVAKKEDLLEIRRLLDVIRMPVLGLITYTPTPSRLRRRILNGLLGFEARARA